MVNLIPKTGHIYLQVENIKLSCSFAITYIPENPCFGSNIYLQYCYLQY